MGTICNNTVNKVANVCRWFLTSLLFVAGSALGGVGGSVVPTFPAGPLNVGATFNASIIITNDSDAPDDDDLINVTSIFLTPSCGSGIGTCAQPDLNVFDLPATGTGAALSACAGITFTVGAPNMTTGEVQLTPNMAWTLGPSNASGGPTLCEIEFTGVQVLRIPTIDSSATAGTQTSTLARASFSSEALPNPVQSAGQSTTTITGPGLVITKSPDGATINAGQTATFTILVSNASGSGAATNVILSDSLPNVLGLVWALDAPVTGCAITGVSPQVLNCDIPSIAAGGSQSISVSAVTNPQACTVMNNVVQLTGTNGFTFPEPQTNAADITCQQVNADVSVTKTDGVASVNSGSSTTYTVVVANAGPLGANNTVLTDPAQTGLTKTAVSCGSPTGGAACPAPASVTVAAIEGAGITIPTLPSGGSVTFLITATVTAAGPGTVSNTATATVPAGTIDPVPANNSQTDTDTVVPITADLQISKTDGAATVNAGGTTTYTVVVTNNGPFPANNAVVTDPATAGLTKTGATCGSPTGGAACPAPAAVTVAALEGAGVTIPTLPSGGSVTFIITANVTATSGSVSNTATVAPPPGTTDPTPGNNSSTDTSSVQPIANLGITKTDGTSSTTSGGSTTYTVVVSNAGPSAADNAIVTDPAATGMTKTAVACSNPTGGAACPAPAAVTIAALEGAGVVIPTLPSGGSVTFTVTVTVTATTGTVTNTVTVAPPMGTTDPTPGSNTASDTNNVTLFTFSITKVASTTVVPPGSAPLTFTVTATNNGPASADGSIISDPAIANFIVTGLSCQGAGGAVCPVMPTIAQLQGAGLVIPTLPAGGSIILTLDGTSTLTDGSLTNEATITPPSGVPVSAVSAAATVTTQVRVIPTLGTSTLIGLMLLLAGMAGAVIRRRG